jgi:hypothetical protein
MSGKSFLEEIDSALAQTERLGDAVHMTASADTKQKLRPDSCTVGWICVISTENTAARTFLDDTGGGLDVGCGRIEQKVDEKGRRRL